LTTREYDTNQEILQDVKNGKARPWKPKKTRNLVLSDSFKRLGNDKKSSRTKLCACQLGFLKNLETGAKTLKYAMFCQVPLCPMCQWRKSLKMFFQLSKVMDETERRHESLVPIFLTCTVKNCRGEELHGTVDAVLQGWHNFNRHRKAQKLIKGWFRALEITYNAKCDTFHPHIHAILLVDKSYFKSKDYMQTVDWVRLWRTSAGLDYDPICDIRKVKANKGKHKAVAEVAKYTLKDSEFLTKDDDLTDKLVTILDSALYKRRLVAYGGVLKQIAKELKADKPDEGDLVHIDEDAIREDVATVLETYSWSFGASNYVKV